MVTAKNMVNGQMTLKKVARCANGKKKKGIRKLRPNKKLADDLFRKIIRERDKICQNCSSPYNPQVAHLISRRYYQTRWNLDNAVILCQKCHMKFTYDPLSWDDWCLKRLGNKWHELKIKAREYKKINYKEIFTYLTKKG